MRASHTIVAAVLVAGLAGPGAPAEPAAAGERPQKQLVSLHGLGTYLLTDGGAATFTGEATGTPFDGTFAGVLTVDDGTLPDPGVCEPATASVRFDGPVAGSHRWMVTDGSAVRGPTPSCGSPTPSPAATS